MEKIDENLIFARILLFVFFFSFLRWQCTLLINKYTFGFYWAISCDFIKLIAHPVFPCIDMCAGVGVYICNFGTKYGWLNFGTMSSRKPKKEFILNEKPNENNAQRQWMNVKFWLFEISFREIHFWSVFPFPFSSFFGHAFAKTPFSLMAIQYRWLSSKTDVGGDATVANVGAHTATSCYNNNNNNQNQFSLFIFY